MSPDVRFRWLDQELAVVLTQIPSEELEPVPDVRYFGFFRGEDQSTFCQELNHSRRFSSLTLLLCCARTTLPVCDN